ncbi:hypothetical protein CEXT_237421 [Caerostris extrusa]|uniref:Uncharacterized protein n=1 Tax=Caerostris extrusa TaxID=172846 RepID=A0AAV4R5R0_CAEEX|nr:hypothetical protein CEXT_237421 [Caerostris extrusa]
MSTDRTADTKQNNQKVMLEEWVVYRKTNYTSTSQDKTKIKPRHQTKANFPIHIPEDIEVNIPKEWVVYLKNQCTQSKVFEAKPVNLHMYGDV